MKAEIEEQKSQHMSILQKHLNEIKRIQSRIDKTLLNLNRIKESNEVSLAMDYISQTEEFSNLLPRVHVSLPTFNSKTKEIDHFSKLFGSLTPLSKSKKKNSYTLKTSTKELLKEPKLYTTINTRYDNLLGVTCFGAEIWTRTLKVSDLKCYNIHGSLMKTIQTKSGRMPNDIAVTDDGDLLYSDWSNGTVYKVRNGQTEEVIKLQGWTPINLCVTSSGHLLVTMCSDDKNKSKVVRFSGLKETQTIQFDDKGEPLYSGKHETKYISENRNLDICVADKDVSALVIVNHSGKVRFRYTGHPSTTKNNKSFVPYGIATDSLGQILTTDRENNCIHILNKDGLFLCCIKNCDLKSPYGLYVDKRDDLFVAENYTGHVKKIQYMK
ncbi:uncharacterized protein LOC134243967 [Saccostrea cucullata]|uniref:uncharacterized protein LOC134243967 n=1 Tax=Saccostrea cuccullata TaxID=36930 RepID=UPI002ED58DE1